MIVLQPVKSFFNKSNFLFIQKCYKYTVCSEVPQPRLRHKTPQIHKYYEVPRPRYGGRYLVTMIRGGGIGPELMEYVEKIFIHAAVPVDFEVIDVKDMDGVDEGITSIKRNRTALISNIENITNEVADGSPNVTIRRKLDLYMNMIHCKPYYGLTNARYCDVDVVLIRQNTEGEYAMLEHENAKGIIESLRIITRFNSERIARRAFEFAVLHNRKKVTVVHKANIMKVSDGLFFKSAVEVSKKFPTIKQDYMLIDNCCMQLVSNPKQFDVLLMPNLFGSLCSAILCGMLGGPGMYAGCNYGPHHAVFEPASRSLAPHFKGKNIANPVGMINAAIEMLYHLRLSKFAGLLDKALYMTICQDKIHTPDLGGTNSSTDVVERIMRNISAIRRSRKKFKAEVAKPDV